MTKSPFYFFRRGVHFEQCKSYEEEKIFVKLSDSESHLSAWAEALSSLVQNSTAQPKWRYRNKTFL